MTDRFRKIEIRTAKTFLNRGGGGFSDHEVIIFLKGYNFAVERLNEFCEKSCNKTCGFCGTENHGKNDKCINCGLKF